MGGVSAVGLISDTHGLMRPKALAALAGSDLIIHAGDVGKPEILDRLRAIAPVVAVRGNVDKGSWASLLPMTAVAEAGPVRLYVLHDLAQLDLNPAAAQFGGVISGHSHKPVHTVRNGVVYINPGSAGPYAFDCRSPLLVWICGHCRGPLNSWTSKTEAWGRSVYTGLMLLETPRLLLREWRPEDREPFARMNADAEVMRYFPAPLSREESDLLIDRIALQFAQRGFGLLALELRDTGEFAGFTGLNVPRFHAHFTPCVEIGWRLQRELWNRGLATEAARAVVNDGFERLGLAEIVSFTTVSNVPSRRVMEKIGMARNPADDFDHPGLPEGHPLRPHVLYRAARGRRLAT